LVVIQFLLQCAGYGIKQDRDLFKLAHLCDGRLTLFDRCGPYQRWQFQRVGQGGGSGGDPLPRLSVSHVE